MAEKNELQMSVYKGLLNEATFPERFVQNCMTVLKMAKKNEEAINLKPINQTKRRETNGREE